MSLDNDRFAYERLLQRIDDPAARSVVVIIVDSDGRVDTAARGVTSEQEMFQIVHHVATGLADELIGELQPKTNHNDRKRPLLYIPIKRAGR